jgi:hypothetical protein
MGNTYGLLHHAVFWDNLDAVVMLIGRGADINMKTRQTCRTLQVPAESTPLHIAATIGNVMIVKQLIVEGADLKAVDAGIEGVRDPATPLDVAATLCCRRALEEAAQLKAQHEDFARHVKGHDWEAALKLVQAGFPVNARVPPPDPASPQPHVPPAEGYVYAVHEAVRQGDIAQYAKFLYAGAFPLQETGMSEEADESDDEDAPPRASLRDRIRGKMPSNVCDETPTGEGIKSLVEEIEKICKAED